MNLTAHLESEDRSRIDTAFGSRERFAEMFSVALVITPAKL